MLFGCTRAICELKGIYNVYKDLISGVFRISERGRYVETWWGAGEGAVPPPQKKNRFLRP